MGNSPVTSEFPSQRTVTRSFDVFFDLRLNKRLSELSWGWWFGAPPRPFWRHCNDIVRTGGKIRTHKWCADSWVWLEVSLSPGLSLERELDPSCWTRSSVLEVNLLLPIANTAAGVSTTAPILKTLELSVVRWETSLLPSILQYQTHPIPKHKCFWSRLAVAFAHYIEARC